MYRLFVAGLASGALLGCRGEPATPTAPSRGPSSAAPVASSKAVAIDPPSTASLDALLTQRREIPKSGWFVRVPATWTCENDMDFSLLCHSTSGPKRWATWGVQPMPLDGHTIDDIIAIEAKARPWSSVTTVRFVGARGLLVRTPADDPKCAYLAMAVYADAVEPPEAPPGQVMRLGALGSGEKCGDDDLVTAVMMSLGR